MRGWKTRIYNAYAGVFASFDLLVSPTTPIPALPHCGGKGGIDVIDRVRVDIPAVALHSHIESPSHAGLPAIGVPCGFISEDLPVGLQIVGPLYADAAVITAAARYE